MTPRPWIQGGLLALVLAGPGLSDSGGVPADRLAREKGLIVSRVTGPAENFSRHCQGCHGHHGVSVPEVPQLRDRVGLFVHTEEGRTYLARVPGVAFAHLSDGDLADVLNWTLRTYSPGRLPPDFTPYTAEEVGALRRQPVGNVSRTRAAVVEGLVSAGVIPHAETLGFGTDRKY